MMLRIMLRSALVCIFVAMSFVLAHIFYLSFYYARVPIKNVQVDVPLQYGITHPPSSLVQLPKSLHAISGHKYSLAAELIVPCNHHNLNYGNFMVFLDLLDSHNNTIASASKSSLVPRLLFCTDGYRQAVLNIPLIDEIVLKHSSKNIITSALLKVGRHDTTNELNVVESSLHFNAQMRGISSFMYNHSIAALFIIVPIFFFIQSFTALILWFCLFSRRSTASSSDLSSDHNHSQQPSITSSTATSVKSESDSVESQKSFPIKQEDQEEQARESLQEPATIAPLVRSEDPGSSSSTSSFYMLPSKSEHENDSDNDKIASIRQRHLQTSKRPDDALSTST